MGKITSALMSIILVFTFLGFSINSYASEFNNAELMFTLQKNACEAHEKLYNSFVWNDTYIYPENFGGDYIDYDTLHVQVTTASAIPYYESLLSEYEPYIVYEIVEHSYNELYIRTESLVSALEETYSIITYGIDVTENKGFISINSSDGVKIAQCINTISPYNKDADESIIKIEFRDNFVHEASIVAGTMVSYSTPTQIQKGTIGGSGTYNNTTAFITSGHFHFNIGDSVTVGSSAIGTVSVKQDAANQYGDYAIITAASGYTPTSYVFTSGGNTTKFTSYLNNPAVGTYLYKYGYESQQAYGVVTRTGITANGRKGISEVKLSSGTSANGDSGGPYRNDDYFCGVHMGSSTSGSTTYVYFTPYVYISNAGFTIATN